jgi:hypothetical protein
VRGPALFLVLLGLAQMTGDLLGWNALRGLMSATTASPAPKVFSAVDGFETYSTRFFVEWTDPTGTTRSLELTPEIYARVGGPYNRRNAYGAILAYGPILSTNPATSALFESVARFALCGRSPLLAELGVEVGSTGRSARVRLEPLDPSALKNRPRVFEARCS